MSYTADETDRATSSETGGYDTTLTSGTTTPLSASYTPGRKGKDGPLVPKKRYQKAGLFSSTYKEDE